MVTEYRRWNTCVCCAASWYCKVSAQGRSSKLGRVGAHCQKAIILVAVIGSFALAFIFVWMNRFSYQHKGMMIVRINRFSGQVCHLQNDGTWNSNLVAPPGWLDTYMRHPDFRASRSYGPNTLEKGVSGDKPGTIIPLEDAEKQAQAYALKLPVPTISRPLCQTEAMLFRGKSATRRNKVTDLGEQRRRNMLSNPEFYSAPKVIDQTSLSGDRRGFLAEDRSGASHRPKVLPTLRFCLLVEGPVFGSWLRTTSFCSGFVDSPGSNPRKLRIRTSPKNKFQFGPAFPDIPMRRDREGAKIFSRL